MSYLLEGLKVIDAASFLAGPGAATIMADFGADVIKVEAPSGDGYRRLHGQYHHDYNWHLTSRNKRDIALDITLEEGRAVLKRLIQDADVLIVNFREDQIRRFGLEYDSLHQLNPRLIYAQLTGFGSVGPDRERRGYDTTAWWARSGIMDMTKPFGGAPTFPVGGVGDHASAMTLYAAIMTALYDREKTGEGRMVSTSLVANGCWSAGMHLQGAIAGYDIASLLDEKGYRSPFATVYKTRDDKYVVMVTANPDKEWGQIARCLDRETWLQDYPDTSSVMKNKDAVRDLLAARIGALTSIEFCTALDSESLTFSLVEKLADVVKDAHLIENQVVVPTDSSNEDYQWTIANPIQIKGADKKPPADPPSIGEHTRAILLAAGYSRDEIDGLIQANVAVDGAGSG